MRGLRRAVAATGAGLLGAGTHPAPPRATRRSPTRSATSASATCSGTRPRRRSRGCTSTSGCPTRRRRSAPSTACAATCLARGPRRELALPPRPRHRPRLRPRDDHARLAALRRPAGDARLRRLLRTSALLCRAADVPDYTWFWWKVRPHPRLGTVEIRALDVQASLEDTRGARRPDALPRPPRRRSDAGPRPTRRPSCSRRARSAPRGSASAPSCPAPTARGARSRRGSTRRSSSPPARRGARLRGGARGRVRRLVARRRRRAAARGLRDRGDGRAAARPHRDHRRGDGRPAPR